MFLFVMSVALWFVRFALSTGWLVAIATFCAPVFNAVNALVHNMKLGSIAITICVAIAGFHILRGNAGRGWAMVATALMLTVLSITLFRDPITDLYSDNGLLALGRGTGFSIAQAATGTSFASGTSLDSQLDGLMSQVVTAGIRHPLQVVNFGMVVDDIGGCSRAWSNAVIAAGGVSGSGPAHAMEQCGAPQALAYAQRLGGSDLSIVVVLGIAGALFAAFFFYVGLSVMLVGIKAGYFGILVGPALLIGLAGFGRSERFAKHCAVELGMHVVQIMVFEIYLAVSMLGLTWVLTAGTSGSTTSTAVPRLLLMGLAAALLALGFRFVDRSFHTDGLGTIGRQVHGVWSAGVSAGRRPIDEATAHRDNARKLADRIRSGRTTGDTDGDSDHTQGNGERGFDLFKPRPTRPSRSRTGAHGSSSTTAHVLRATAKVAAPEAAGVAAVVKDTGTVVGTVRDAAGHQRGDHTDNPSDRRSAPLRQSAQSTSPAASAEGTSAGIGLSSESGTFRSRPGSGGARPKPSSSRQSRSSPHEPGAGSVLTDTATQNPQGESGTTSATQQQQPPHEIG
jgi:hypothetical protein